MVNNLQSMEAQPVDVSGNHDAITAPHGINENNTSALTTTNTENIIPSENNASLIQGPSADVSLTKPYVDEIPVSHAELEPVEHTTSNENTKAEINQASTENQESEAYEIGSVKSAGFDGSLGSDTDTNKIDNSGNGKDTVPRYSAKKPAGFKPVSVTKSFLAKAGTALLPLKAVGDKGMQSHVSMRVVLNCILGVASPSSPVPGSAASATRPRLVAKTLSSSRSAAPKALNASFKQTGADGPDPNQVWNRNRGSLDSKLQLENC